jgi:hypothetical protein
MTLRVRKLVIYRMRRSECSSLVVHRSVDGATADQARGIEQSLLRCDGRRQVVGREAHAGGDADAVVRIGEVESGAPGA